MAVLVLGTFDDPLQALTDFDGNALLISVFNAPTSDSEQDILDRDTDCGISEDVPILAPPRIRATAFAADGNAALLRTQCRLPTDCPDIDRTVIRSVGCNPPPNCIAEPDAARASRERPSCRLPVFLPPRSTTRVTRNLEFSEASATAKAYDMSFEDAGGLTNYIEVPFMQFARFRGEDATTHDFLTHYDTIFNGTVRLWESGTVEFIGFAKTDAPLGRTYRVWEGDSPTDAGGQHHDVIALPGDNTYYAVNFAVKPASGKSIHVIAPFTLNTGGTSDGNRVVLWSYAAGGWIFPVNFNIGSDAGIMGAIDRSGTNSTCVGSSGTWTTISNNAVVWSYLCDNSWDNRASFISEYGAVGVSGTFNLSRTIPDSATQGVLWFCADAQGGTNQAWGTFAVGPILRSDYDPVVQQGVDPLG